MAPVLASPPEKDDSVLADFGADPGELDRQGWGVVIPEGDHGKALLAAIKPLVFARAEAQRAEVVVYEVAPSMSAERTANWIRNEYKDKVGRSTGRLPRYLLLLGGPEQISWATQLELSSVAMVGRLSFDDAGERPDIKGYEAYAHKVLQWEAERAAREPKVVFYAVRDSSGATEAGQEHLLLPNLTYLQETDQRGSLVSIGVGGPPAPHAAALQEKLAETWSHVPNPGTVLFSVSHGKGGDDWPSPAEQRNGQGAMVIGRERLSASDVGESAFLPGGVWFFFACYSAGTPAESLYAPWVARLHAMGRFSKTPAQMVLSAPKDGRPFTAALAQAALRNERGPLGVIGHVDLALSSSFLGEDYGPDNKPNKPYPERFAGLVQSLLLGRRLGVAFDSVAQGHRELSSALAARYAAEAADATLAQGEDQRATLAALWLERQDLRSFVLLGDPAARLPIARTDRLRRRSRAAPRRSPREMEDAVIEHLRGARIQDIATRLGESESEVDRWVAAFLEGAREALSKLP